MKQNNQTMLAMGLFLALAATGNAETSINAAPPATPPKAMGMEMQPGMGMHHGMGGMGGMGGMMAGMTEEQKDQHLRGMQDHMLKMHDLSNQILAEKDATKKEQLKTQQLQLMKEHHAGMKERRQEMREMRKK